MKHIGAVALALLCGGAGAAEKGELLLGGGLHYSQGKYGTPTTTKITALVFSARYDVQLWTLRDSVSYLFVEGSEAVVPGVGAVRGSSAAADSSASGLGDATLSATYVAHYDAASRFGVDVGGKVKLATAEDDRLGTGENDYGALVEVYKDFGPWTAFGGLGYTVMGSPPGVTLNDVVSFAFGASYRLDERTRLGASYDEREAATSGAPQREVTLFYSTRLQGGWRAQGYLLFGLANGSPDWGAGLSATYPF